MFIAAGANHKVGIARKRSENFITKKAGQRRSFGKRWGVFMGKPVVASYCATFLKPEMLHIYRQITSLRRVRPVVIAQKRENANLFPFQAIRIVEKPALHFLRRIWFKQIADRPWQTSPAEVRAIERALTESNA